MRHRAYFSLPSSLLVLTVCAGMLSAAPTPYIAQVYQAEAEVRCKPSAKPELYPTNRLPQGTRVLVLEERTDGWLSIQPPPGSFSWIDAAQVERIVPTQANWVVKNDGVPVLIGSEFVQQRPTVEGVRLVRGTQVRGIGQVEKDGTTLWLPIDPPAGEVRYIRAETVRALTTLAAQTATPSQPAAMPVSLVRGQTSIAPSFDTVRTSASPGGTAGQTAALAIPAQTPATLSPNATAWEKVYYLEQQGRWDDAIHVYDQLARDLQRSNPAWANFAAKRADYLRKGGRELVNVPFTQPAGSSSFQPEARIASPTVQPQQPVRLSAPVEAQVAAPATAGQTASWSSPQATAAAGQTTGPGRLVRSYVKVNGVQAYRLETVDGFVYVTPGPGVDLEALVDRNISVVGTTQYSAENRVYCVVVSRVLPM
ncbi:MAG TPA: hypothetical protein VHY20_02830 [Pirellulales bacterium]|nr:hypothetical protein [Pirellulales bacterium]